MNNLLKNKKGITLVALVITIILLLILAGISISALTDNGVFRKTKEAREATIREEMKERLILSIQNVYLKKVGNATIDDITQEWANKELSEYKGEIIEDDSVSGKKVTMQKNEVSVTFLIDENLNITETTETSKDIEIQYKAIAVSADSSESNVSSVGKATQARWTTLYINIIAELEGEYCEVTLKDDPSKTVPYAVTKNGTYVFTVTGMYNGKTIIEEKEVTVNQFKGVTEAVQYDAGDWTETEIQQLKDLSLYNININKIANGDKGLDFTFGGFTYNGDVTNSNAINEGTIITSRNQSVAPQSGYGTPYYDGWQILESETKNGKTYVTKLMHAGNPENFVFYFNVSYDTYRSEYILSGGKRKTEYNTYNPRSWDMYKDKELDNKGYIKEVHVMTYDEAVTTSKIVRTGGNYWLATTCTKGSGGLWSVEGATGARNNYSEYCFGVRPVVELNEGVYITSGDGTEESPYILGKD